MCKPFLPVAAQLMRWREPKRAHLFAINNF
jgi:hypothetical protein